MGGRGKRAAIFRCLGFPAIFAVNIWLPWHIWQSVILSSSERVDVESLSFSAKYSKLGTRQERHRLIASAKREMKPYPCFQRVHSTPILCPAVSGLGCTEPHGISSGARTNADFYSTVKKVGFSLQVLRKIFGTLGRNNYADIEITISEENECEKEIRRPIPYTFC